MASSPGLRKQCQVSLHPVLLAGSDHDVGWGGKRLSTIA